MVILESHGNAILGKAEFFDQSDECLVYCKRTILDNLKKQGMDEDEAREFYSYNILGAYYGMTGPIFLDKDPLEL